MMANGKIVLGKALELCSIQMAASYTKDSGKMTNKKICKMFVNYD